MFVANGGILRDGEPVTHITPGARVTVTSSQRNYDAGSVVITAGAWASKMTRPLGLNLPLKVGYILPIIAESYVRSLKKKRICS